MKKRVLNIDGYPIDHADLRFRKIIAVSRVPRLGETLDLETQSGRSLKATVARVELDEPRELFIVACQYAARVITLDDYSALADDPEWELKHLLDP